ncbi:VRR-NUC domain-containing protein [uncultured Methanobrevibacter sp.]|uniref:VRR-NUC domain-containing protein n=1 Tax=uncultured Methanobrevibacter sp. TaxID=253161 RepID=UPI003207FC4B
MVSSNFMDNVLTDDDFRVIEEYIDKYDNLEFEPLKYPSNDSNLIFKNLNIEDIGDFDCVEDFVIDYYKQQGYFAFFAENRYWLLLLLIIYFKQDVMRGRLFVELDFATNAHSDNYIRSLKYMNFNYIKDIPNLVKYIIKSYYDCVCSGDYAKKIFKNGDPDHNLFSIDELLSSICHLDIEQLILIFKRMADDFEYYTSGLPDLIVCNKNEFFFVEVKSEKDKPSFKQIQWHKYLVNVVNVDIVIFNINKSVMQMENIKEMYSDGLLDSKKRQSLKHAEINWSDFKLEQDFVEDDEINERMKRRYGGFITPNCNDYSRLRIDSFNEPNQWYKYKDDVLKRNLNLLYERVYDVYFSKDLDISNPTKKQLSRNNEAKLLENKGDYQGAISLYIENVLEKTSSPTTYKRLISIYKKFGQFEELKKLMEIAIPIFVNLNDKNNTLYFLLMKFSASQNSGKLSLTEERILKKIREDDLKLNKTKEKDRQTDLSRYFK